MPRQRVPTHLRLLRGNPGNHPVKLDLMPERPPEPPSPPNHLHPYALEEWHRLARQLWSQGLLTALDVGPFSAYCFAVSILRQAREKLCELGTEGFLATGSNHNQVRSVWLKIANEAARDVTRFGAEFGLSPSARRHVSNVTSIDRSPLDDLLA